MPNTSRTDTYDETHRILDHDHPLGGLDRPVHLRTPPHIVPNPHAVKGSHLDPGSDHTTPLTQLLCAKHQFGKEKS